MRDQGSSATLPAPAEGWHALSQQQRQEHRARVGARAESILGQFWRDDETEDAVRAIEIEGWCDVLEKCSHDEIRAAWAEYQTHGPRSQKGTLIKPDAGAIWRIVMASRPKAKPVPVQEKDGIRGKVAAAWRETEDRLSRGDHSAKYSLTEWRCLLFGYYLHGKDSNAYSDFVAWRAGNREADVSEFLEKFGIRVAFG